MLRVILGAIIGFIVWILLLMVTDAVWLAISPDWFGKHQTEFQAAVNNKTPFMVDSTILIITVIRSAIFTVITGYIAALIAKENFKSPALLGVLLFLFGGVVSLVAWNYLPFWYHLGILLPLIPLAILGGKLRKVEEVHNF
jgi:hypothetical protein